MWIREEIVSRQFLNGPRGTSHPFLHVHRSGRRVYSNRWPRESTMPTCYFSFVSRAVLWDRGRHHHTDSVVTKEPRPPCSRFEAHMRACPSQIRPPYFPRTHHLARSPLKTLRAPKPPRRQETQRKQNSLRHFSVNLPISVPASPHPSVASPDPVLSPTPSVQAGTNPEDFLSFQVHPPNSEHTAIKQEVIVGQRDVTSSPQVGCESSEEPKGEVITPMTLPQSTPSTPMTPLTPITPMTPDSLSDLSRPGSSQFSYSTNLNSSLSNAPSVNQSDDSNGDDGDTEDGDNINHDDLEACFLSLSDLRFSSLDGAVLASCSTSTSTQSSLSKNLRSRDQEPQNTNHPKALKKTPSIPFKAHAEEETPHPNQLTDLGVGEAPSLRPAYLDSQSRPASASPLDVWKTCRWPLLPPITPQRGSQGSRASPSSQISCSQSDMFAELEAAAPRSVSCLSLDHADCSDKEIISSATDLSPGLAALTVGCDSGNLGSLSRVQLLLLERGASEGLESPLDLEWNSPMEDRGDYEPGLQVWSLGIPQHYQCADPYVQINSSVSQSVKHFPFGQVDIRRGTPGPSDAEDISRSSSWSLSCGSRDNTSCDDRVTVAQSRGSDLVSDPDLDLSTQPIEPSVTEGTSQKAACPGKRERPAIGVRRGPNQIKDRKRRHQRKMLGKKGEEWKTKALQIYTKLQDGNKPSEPSKPRSCSRFEDFDFLAKYCIISPEKLAAYRRAFEAVDSDGDGYLSCFQVLLALKEIIPPELLTEDEEIYVYR
ncbi:proline-rich protein 36-like isoform X4, partial [Clarias magur]